MKAGILTWYKALNHGAVLQAYATQMVLQELGHECGMLDYDRKVVSQQSTMTIFKKKIRSMLPWEYDYRKKLKLFEDEKRELFDKFIEEKLTVFGNYSNTKVDIAIIGSDMVFSLGQGYNPYMFGKGVLADKLISYAASSGGSKVELAKKMGVEEEISNQLKLFDAIGCRDHETEQFVRALSGRTDVKRNIDPVLLFGFEKELTSWDSLRWSKHSPYILLYSYTGNMDSTKEIEEIREFARKNHLCIVSCGYYHPWCDENIDASPQEFLEMVKNSEYIITDTFHGTVFSLIAKKPFVSIIRGNGFKLKTLLCESGMDDRIAGPSNSLIGVLNKKIDYNPFNSWYELSRNESLMFLKEQLR
jgi:hypothetical protein